MSETFHPRFTPWQIDGSEFYELESFDEQMRFLLRYAVLAPSGHNTQPWVFRIANDGVEVFAGYTRGLPAVDPDERELLMSVGAAITDFRVAAAHFGFDTSVSYERRPEEQLPVALISVCETCAPDRSLAALFRAIVKRHTNRAPFDGQSIEPRMLTPVCDVIDRFPETFGLIAVHDNRRVGEMIEQAQRDRGLAESASALLLVTAEDDRVSLLRAGEALELLLLTITDVGLQYSFLNQPVSVKEMRDQLGTLAGASHPAQLLIRIGSAPPVEGAMPRRPTGDTARRIRIAVR